MQLIDSVAEPPMTLPVSRAISFLVEHTNQDEATILARALRSGLALLYRQAVEQAYVNDDLSRSEALTILGSESVTELDYVKRAILADIKLGWIHIEEPR